MGLDAEGMEQIKRVEVIKQELGGGPLTNDVVALRLLQIVGDHMNGIPVEQSEAVARGLLMVTTNPVAQRMGEMLIAMFELGKEWNQAEADPAAPMLWLN